MNKDTKQKGFTIVELLIVIVVIGILAAIVIVAYQGVTARSKKTSYETAAKAVLKKIELYNVAKGGYPSSPAFVHGQSYDLYTGDANPDTALRLPEGVRLFYFDEIASSTTLDTNAPFTYDNVTLSAADGAFPGLPNKTYIGGVCTGGRGFKLIYPNPITKQNEKITTGTC